MSLSLILSSFALLFLAEIGDKTQLMAMTLAHRYRVAPVIAGTFLAFLVLNLLSVALGGALSQWLPRRMIVSAAAALFLWFAWRSWLAGGEEEEEEEEIDGHRVLLTSFMLIFVAELGDKTQLALIALAAQSGDPVAVFLGGTAALWTISLLGIFVGAKLLRRFHRRYVQRAAAGLFAAFGLAALVQAARM